MKRTRDMHEALDQLDAGCTFSEGLILVASTITGVAGLIALAWLGG